MRVAILGASGFIGRELVAKLTGEHDVIAVARKRPESADSEVRWVEADLTRPEDAERALARSGGRGTPDPLARLERLRAA